MSLVVVVALLAAAVWVLSACLTARTWGDVDRMRIAAASGWQAALVAIEVLVVAGLAFGFLFLVAVAVSR